MARETTSAPSANSIEVWEISSGYPFMFNVICLPDCWGPLPEEATSPHNPVVQGNLLYVSWYEAGVLAFDISDPLDIREIRRLDTYPFPPTAIQFFGCWGVYPFLGPERILATDTESGLYVLSHGSSHSVEIPGAAGDRNFGFRRSGDPCP